MIEYAGILSKQKINKIKEDGFNTIDKDILFLIYRKNNKFYKENIVNETDNKISLLEGIILNSNQFIKKNQTFADIELTSETIKEFRGNFSGFVWDKTNKEISLFVDHIGIKRLFYYYDKGKEILIFGNKFDLITKIMHKNNIPVKLDELGAYSLLAFGYMIGDITLIKNLKKLRSGHILKLINNKIQLKEYYKLSNFPQIDANENEIIEELDKIFRKAIQLEYKKDLEYGYKHIITLSGGLDSRLNMIVAHKMGYNNFLNICFSENDYLDEKIAKQISDYYKDEFLFYSLNNGVFLKEIEKTVLNNNGLVFYAGAAHTRAMLEKINFTDYGVLHTGQIGDGFLGTFLKKTKHEKPSMEIIKKKIINKQLKIRVEKLTEYLISNYITMEMILFKERCVNGVFNGIWQIEAFNESISPFLYVDFIDFITKVSPAIRYDHILHKKWINKKYPDINKFGWEKKYGLKPNASMIFEKIKNYQFRIECKLNGYCKSMNPFMKWEKRNKTVVEELDRYFEDNINKLKGYDNLKNEIEKNYFSNNLLKKSYYLTLITAIKIFKIE